MAKQLIDLLRVLEKNENVYAVNPVNTVGVMGAGLAKQFKDKYPSHYEKYRRAYSSGKLKTGKVLLDSENRIITFPTKQHWRNPSTEGYIRSGAKSLKDLLDSDVLPKNAKVIMPKLGSGLGGLNFDRQVAPILKQELGMHGDKTAVILGDLIKQVSKL